MEEIWKDIEGASKYEISNKFRVRHKETGYIKKQTLDKSKGYYVVNLTFDDGVQRTRLVHRLGMEAFVPNPENKRTVNHESGDKTVNTLENLSWATDSENMLHAFRNGLCENTRAAAREQVKKMQEMPKTERQLQSARENIIKVNQRPKTEKQIETTRQNITSSYCREQMLQHHYDRHPPIRVMETGKIYISQKELANELGVNETMVCDCLHGRRTHAGGYHFEYVTDGSDNLADGFLRDYQYKAVTRMFNGCILNGGTGSGKSRTGLYYYFSRYGGMLNKDGYTPMTNPTDLIIITTAKKRDDKEWLGELAPYLMSTNPEENRYNNKVVVDSWQNVQKYADIRDSFFIFDEDHVTGWGAWTKAFLKIVKSNEWIILSATAGDVWTDYMAVFIANGFYKNKTEFQNNHVRYDPRCKNYPRIIGYCDERRLIRLRDRILIDMDFDRHTTQHHEDIIVQYDVATYKDVMKRRWDIFKDEPIQQAAGLCYVLRKIVNSDDSRKEALLELHKRHPKMIVFYNFDYEREILLSLDYGEDVEVAEYSGHRHMPIPDSRRWVYICQYTSGCEGFNCTRTDTIAFFSQNYSYKVMTQAAGRIDRLTTPYTDLHYYHLKSRSPIDLAISKALREKKKFNETKFANW